jgi:plasmid maintenance system antidote protein VapI
MAKDKFYTVADAAKFLGVTRQTVAAAIGQKRLTAKKAAFVVERVVKTKVRGWVVSEAALKAYQVSAQHQDAGKKND